MRITEVEVDEFEYRIEDAGIHEGRRTYEPGSVSTPPGFVLTIRTENGLEGHYRGSILVPPMIPQIEMVAEAHLLGRSPLEREAIWTDLWRALRHTDHLGVGPIDAALWDLVGKHHDASVSTLLGGFKNSIPTYASTCASDASEDGLGTPEAYARFAEECQADGYPAFKVHPFGDPDRDVELVRAVDDAVGDEMDLMLDASDEYDTYSETLRVGRALDERDFLWYEDPMIGSGDSIAMARRLFDKLDTPILGGELVRSGPVGMANHLSQNDYEYYRADVHLDGGITGTMKMVHLAEAFGVDVEFHGGGPATIHCLSAIRNTNYFEHALLHPELEWKNAQGLETDVDRPNEDGRVVVPDGPGLGVDIDWDFVEGRRTDRTVFAAGGSADCSP